MTVTLSKGGNVSLSKASDNLTKVKIALGWKVKTTTQGAEFDLDACAIALNAQGKVLGDSWFVFFNNLKSPDGSIEHAGDNLIGGDGDSDDEIITIDLAALSPGVKKVVFPVSIYEAQQRHQSFGQVSNAFIRVIDDNNGAELARYDLSEDASGETAMIFGELYRLDQEWKFRAIGQGYASGLRGIALDYGVNV